MENNNLIDPKERILTVAAELFAKYGYSSVGVREIAKGADVNISMISYYYSGKMGILKDIIKVYFDGMRAIVIKIAEQKKSASDDLDRRELTMRDMVKEIVYLFKSKPHICKVAIAVAPIDIPEVKDFKLQMLTEHLDFVFNSLQRCDPSKQNIERRIVVGQAYFSMIYSHFLFGTLVKETYDLEFDDQFYERYAETIATLFLSGVRGLAELDRKKEEKNNNINLEQ